MMSNERKLIAVMLVGCIAACENDSVTAQRTPSRDASATDAIADARSGSGGGGTAGSSARDGSSGSGGVAGTAPDASIVTCGGGTAQASDVTIDVSDHHQKISGFGVSTAWGSDFVDPVRDPDTLWSTTTGAGLTLHRIRIGGGTTSETKIAQKAVSYGVKVWATPWEVKRSDISRDNCPNNSACDPPPKLTNPQDWANTLAAFVQNMKGQGVPIYAVSAENEPDSGGMNGTTSFTASELATWIGSYLGPALAGTDAKLMAPETMNWWSFPSYFDAIKSNSAAYASVAIFASHQYGRGPEDPASDVQSVNQAVAADSSKEYWETEVDTGSTPDDPTADNMPSALHLAETIHNDLTKASINAFHYWWLYAGGSSGLFDTNTKVWTKRFWVMGNFSRFARPGYVRVSTSGNAPDGVDLSAYVDPANKTLAIVAINYTDTSLDVPVYISDDVPCTLTPYETSDSKSLGQNSDITVTKSRVTLSLPPKSVTTFAGKP